VGKFTVPLHFDVKDPAATAMDGDAILLGMLYLKSLNVAQNWKIITTEK